MWIEKTPTGKFKACERYTDLMTGKQKKVSVTMDKNTAQSRKRAQAALNEKIHKALSASPHTELSLKVLVEKYLTEQSETVKKSTYRRNFHSCTTIMSILGPDVMVNKITAGYIRKCLLATGKAPGTMNEHIIRIKALLRWGYQNDYINDVSYLDKLENFKDMRHKEKIQDKYMESSEVHVLLDNMSIDKWRELTEFLIMTGLRIGEALALEINDIDLKERQIHVTKTFDTNNMETTTPKTIESLRDVYIQDDLLSLCRILKKNALTWRMVSGSNLIFQDENGRYRYAAYNKYLRDNTEKIIGRKLTAHALRHTHVSLLAEQGIDFDTIARRVGHDGSKVTREIYFHVTKKLKERDDSTIASIHIL